MPVNNGNGIKLPFENPIKSNGNGDKVFRPFTNLKTIFTTIIASIAVLGFFTSAVLWGQAVNDSTKQVKRLDAELAILNAKHDTCQIIQTLENTGSFELQKAVLRKVDPGNAEEIITRIESQRIAVKETAEKQLAEVIKKLEKKLEDK